MIESIKDIQNLILSGNQDWKQFGEVSTKQDGDLILFNYTAQAQFAANWNYFERVSRGLIFNVKTAVIVARPFDKFFNWGEGDRYSTADIVSVTEKVDGSLGILYRDNGFKVATRGSFDGKQALWATQFLNNNFDLSSLPDEMTLLFEIVYPDNRIIVDYGNKEDLVLLAIRNRFTGEYYSWDNVKRVAMMYGFNLPAVYGFDNTAQILNAAKLLDSDSEGWVVEFSDGERFKFKGNRYLELHRLISGLSYKNVLLAVANNTIEEMIKAIPDEFLTQVETWIQEISNKLLEIECSCNSAFELAPKETRKEFAVWVNQNCKELSPYMFALLDGKDIKPIIYKWMDK